MPYSKRRESCTNKSGEKGTFVTIKKDGGKRQCWKSEKAFNNAQKARHTAAASESHHVAKKRRKRRNLEEVILTRAAMTQQLSLYTLISPLALEDGQRENIRGGLKVLQLMFR